MKKDTVETIEEAMIEVINAVALAKKVNTNEAQKAAREKAERAVRLAVSQYMEELFEKGYTIDEISKKYSFIDTLIETKGEELTQTDDRNTTLEKTLKNWRDMKVEIMLINLCRLIQVDNVSYDYVLGLDKKNRINQLNYGCVLDFFFYLFRNKKIMVFREKFPNKYLDKRLNKDKDHFFAPPATPVASKGCFNMTRYLLFTDEKLLDIFNELNYQEMEDRYDNDKSLSGYKMLLREFISKYENEPLVSGTSEIDTSGHIPASPDNGQSKPSKKTYHRLPDDLADRLGSLAKKYGKTQKQFCKDACIAESSISYWKKQTPEVSSLYLLAITHGFSIDQLLRTGASDKNEERHQHEYTYGDTLRFIDQLQTMRVIRKAVNSNGLFPATSSACHNTKNSGGENPNNITYLNREQAYFPGLFLIKDDFLLRLITEMEAEMSRSFNPPQSSDIAQPGYEMSKQKVEKIIAKYESESLLCYREEKVEKALNECSKKWRNPPRTSILDMSVDLDEMLKELRATEIDALKRL